MLHAFFATERRSTLETVIEGSTLEALRAGLRGAAYAPGDEGYDEARQA